MDVKEILYKLIQQHFGYFSNEITPVFNLYDTLLTIDELSDFIVDVEEAFAIDIDESKIPLSKFKDMVQYIEELLANNTEGQRL